MYEAFLNRGIHPRILQRGSIGEGDITTLSVIGQAMIGAGDVEYHGKVISATEALALECLNPAVFGPKDSLSIVSSNAQGEAITALLIHQTEELLKAFNAVFCLSLEGLNGGLQPLDETPTPCAVYLDKSPVLMIAADT